MTRYDPSERGVTSDASYTIKPTSVLPTSPATPVPERRPAVTADLVARLLAAIDAKEAKARAAITSSFITDGRWVVLGSEDVGYYLQSEARESIGTQTAGFTAEQAVHIVRNDPRAVLRRCAADRRIVGLHHQRPGGPLPEDYGGGYLCAVCGGGGIHEYPVDWPCATLLALAEGYGIAVTG